jgi:hypothetical protein
MAKKKIAELELSLLHLQQNVEIPEIFLSIHPVVQRAIADVCLDLCILLLKYRCLISPVLTVYFFCHSSVARKISVSLLMRSVDPTFQTRRS